MVAEPYCLAFAEYPGLYPPTSPDTILTIMLMTVYAADIALNFVVGAQAFVILIDTLRRFNGFGDTYCFLLPF